MPRKKKTPVIEDDFLPEEAREPVVSTPTEPRSSERYVTIKRAKIKERLFLEGEYTEDLPGHGEKTSKFTCTVPVHDDLKDAFSKLVPHLAILCSQRNVVADANLDDVELPEFGVRSFSIGGSGENEGVTISGWMDGEYGMVNLNTPFTKYENDEYPFISELSSAIHMCIYEVEQYLFEGKRAPEQQPELPFPDQDDPQQALRDLHKAAEEGGEE